MVLKPLAVEDVLKSGISVYPNPVTNLLNIDASVFSSQLKEIKLIDLSGREMFTKNFGSFTERYSVDMSEISDGSYILILKTSSGERFSSTLIKS